MAKKKRRSGVWGIDIGQCGLKALRCVEGDDEDEPLVADAFDYIEYPKVLSQPEADADELIREALEQFLERNEIKGDRVAMSVSGQAGLSRFFKPPPVDAKMIPDIVKYEARQQIPFALEDVIWDFQRIGGQEVDGFVMDAEVGIFAMKRDAVFRALQPFTDAEVEVDIVQLAPLSIYNAVCHDMLGDLPAPEDIDPDDPPESVVVLSVGTETTDLVITNGSRLWQRNIPLGGNHFTKQLTKELKLTYAKAEHLKRNARQAEDPKTVFQVMRPVFNDLVTEIQRSVGYFQSIDRQAKIGKMVLLGNAVKLPGLRQYLSKNLGQEVVKLDTYDSLSGSAVLDAKAFKDNALSFGVAYGLCLQALDVGRIGTNLLPREFITERLIREKKPWAVVSVAALLLAMAFNYFFQYNAWSRVHPELTEVGEKGSVSYNDMFRTIEGIEKESSEKLARDTKQLAEMTHIKSLGTEVVGDGDRKLLWAELIKTIHLALPTDPRVTPGDSADPLKVPFIDREDIQIEYLESEYFQELSGWYEGPVKGLYQIELNRARNEDTANAEGESADEAATAEAAVVEDPGPSGKGWVFEMAGYHFHNSNSRVDKGWGAAYIRNTLLKNLREGTVKLPDQEGNEVEFTYKEMGVGYPILAVNNEINHAYRLKNPNHPANSQGGGRVGAVRGDDDGTAIPLDFAAPKYDFVIQFCWQENPLTQRMELLTKRLEEQRQLEEQRRLEAQQAAEAAANEQGEPAAGNPAPADPAANAGGANNANGGS